MYEKATETIRELEAIEANLERLESIWDQLEVMLPGFGAISGVTDEGKYRKLSRAFTVIADAMPSVDGAKITVSIPDPDGMMQSAFETAEFLDPEDGLFFQESLRQQGPLLQDYRARLDEARREVARGLSFRAIDGVAEQLGNVEVSVESILGFVRAIDAALGGRFERPPGWADVHAALAGGTGVAVTSDEFKELWMGAARWMRRNLYTELDPFPVKVRDLHELSVPLDEPPVVAPLAWTTLTPRDFERLIYNLVTGTAGYANAAWETHLNAPDGGRDIYVERTTADGLSGPRTERCTIACKHQGASIDLKTTLHLLEQLKLWHRPCDVLVLATSSTFTRDVIQWCDARLQGGETPRVERWGASHLEYLLSRRPQLVTEMRLR